MRHSRQAVRKQIIAAAHAFHHRGWVANHDGNITVRMAANRFAATPTATSKLDVSDKNLIEVDGSGKRISGTARPFSELAIHLAIYRARSDVGAVVHAHSPYASAISCTGSTVLTRPFIAEAVVSIGATIPTIAQQMPGPGLAEAVAEAAAHVDAVLCANHGVFAWGSDLEQARLRLELVEHLAKIATLAMATGGVRPLPNEIIQPLLAKRAKAGLGAAANRALNTTGTGESENLTKPRVIACAPAPHANVEVIPPKSSSSESPSNEELVRAIREELMTVLRESEQ